MVFNFCRWNVNDERDSDDAGSENGDEHDGDEDVDDYGIVDGVASEEEVAVRKVRVDGAQLLL